MARIAAGETDLMAQAVRILLPASVALNAVLALVAPMLLSVLFGPEFLAAVPMALILLAAQVPFTCAFALSSGLQADGAPLIPTIAELIALVITVVGLLVLLGPLGGIGAAIVSLAAYGMSFGFQLVCASRRLRKPVREFLVPTRADLGWARARITGLAKRLAAVQPGGPAASGLGG
jgi:O-antigen/teichoic acid export membrane protein